MANSRSESPPRFLILYREASVSFKTIYKRGVEGVTKGIHGSAEGKKTTPGPGRRTIVLRHCDEAIHEPRAA